MAVVQGPLLVALLLLVSPGLHCSSPPPACPEPCTCQRAPLLNCSSSGLSSVPRHIQDSVTDLDLSQNRLDTVTLHRPYRNLRNVWLENNTITRLSLCIDKNLGTDSVTSRNTRQLGPWSRRRCVSWAPTLQLLSVERNQLIRLPEGLEASASLWVLQLSFNRISTIRPGELGHLRQLKELHLRHNLITHLHPQMFQDLTQLRVLDLSFNLLSSLHPSMYPSLRNIGSDVRLHGNRWQCDCSMRALRRRMAYDGSRGPQTWSVVCAFPSRLAGKDLLQLDEDDLNCFGTENSPERHQDVTVSGGSEILLSCSKQDATWLTPGDQESLSQPQASLFIGDVSEKDTGLYVCMTADHEVVSVFNLQISRVEHAKRNARSVPRASPQEIPQERNQRATQSDLTLAVCLSVFITFLIAFILGVFVRPFIDVLWTKITKKKGNPSATKPVSSAEQRQYENEAYSEGEEPEEMVTHRERRVTFSSVKKNDDVDVEYYNTVGKSAQAPKTEEDEHAPRDSGSDKGSRQTSPENNQKDATATGERQRHNVQFEHIPDRNELEERSLSSSSDSSLSDREAKKDQIKKTDLTKPNSLQQSEDSVQQRPDSSTAGIVPPLSTEGTSEIPGFSSSPFADWSPRTDGTKLSDSDLLPGNDEQFDFSDSTRSSSLFGSFNHSKPNVPPSSENQSRDDLSSCSSRLSEGEPTEYTLNPDQEEEEEEEDTENKHNESELTNTLQEAGLDTSRPPVGFNQGNYPHDTLRPAERTDQNLSSQSSDSEQMQYRGNGKKGAVMEYDKPSSQEVAGETETRQKVKPMPRSKWRGVSLGVTSFDPSPPTAHSSSSSSESEAEITDYKVKHHKGWKIKRRQDIKAPSPHPDSSSSSDSEDNTAHLPERPGRVDNVDLTFQTSGAASRDPDVRWPVLDLENIPTIKRRLDIKAPSPPPDSSSSSDSDDETIHAAERPGMVGNAALPLQRFPSATHDPDIRWPVLDLENIPTIKRRLDIKAPSTLPDSSSSSDSEDDTTHLAERPGKVDVTQMNKPDSDSFSSGNEPIHAAERPGMVGNAALPLQRFPSATHDPDIRWPVLDLENIPTIKRRLDIKAPSTLPDSSSSSDSEDETSGHSEKMSPHKVDQSELLFTKPQTANPDPDVRWPALDLENLPTIKRRIDVKAPSPPPDLSSSSDSDDDTIRAAERPGVGGNAKFPFEASGTTSYDPDVRWLTMDLENIPTIERRLDKEGVKVPSLDSNSSSSSDDEQPADSSFSREQKLHNLSLGIPRVRGRLARQSEANSSTSESEEDFKRKKNSPIPGADHNVKLEKYTVITDDVKDKPSDENVTPTLEINPELESRWATMNLGIARFRKHLKSTSQTNVPPNLPTSPLPDSPPSYTGESGTGNISSKKSNPGSLLTGFEKAPPTSSLHLPSDSSSSSEGEDVMSTEYAGNRWKGTSQVAPRESSSSSQSEDETDHGLPHLKPGVPRITTRLNIKAPSPEPDSSSSSSSERDSEVTGHSPEQSLHSSYLSTMTDEEYSKIAYRRTIMRSPMQISSFSSAGRSQTLDDPVAQAGLSHSLEDRSGSLSPRGVSNTEEDCTLDLELSPELRWTGIGRDRSDRSSASRRLDLGLLPPPAESELTPPDRGKAHETVMHRYSYPTASRASAASSRSLDELQNPSRSNSEIFRALSEEKKETKGLGALKAMSMTRLQWDMEDIDV